MCYHYVFSNKGERSVLLLAAHVYTVSPLGQITYLFLCSETITILANKEQDKRQMPMSCI